MSQTTIDPTARTVPTTDRIPQQRRSSTEHSDAHLQVLPSIGGTGAGVADHRTLPRETSTDQAGTREDVRLGSTAAPASSQRWSGLRALRGRLTRAVAAGQIEQSAVHADFARRSRTVGHGDLLMVQQPFLRGLR